MSLPNEPHASLGILAKSATLQAILLQFLELPLNPRSAPKTLCFGSDFRIRSNVSTCQGFELSSPRAPELASFVKWPQETSPTAGKPIWCLGQALHGSPRLPTTVACLEGETPSKSFTLSTFTLVTPEGGGSTPSNGIPTAQCGPRGAGREQKRHKPQGRAALRLLLRRHLRAQGATGPRRWRRGI